MAKILKINKTSDYSRYHGLNDRHPLIYKTKMILT